MNIQEAYMTQWGREVDKAQSEAHQAGEAYAEARDSLDTMERHLLRSITVGPLAQAEREAYRAWRFAVSWLDELQCGE